jgi:hypothetical protein
MTDSENDTSQQNAPRRDPVLRQVAWGDILPWTVLFRALPVSLGGSVLLLAMVGSWLTPVGWQVGGDLFLDESVDTTTLREARPRLEDWPWLSESADFADGPNAVLVALSERAMIPRTLLNYSDGRHIEVWAYLVFGLIWSTAVWSIFGGAIARMTLLRVGRNARCGPIEAVRYCGRRCLSFWGAPLLPLAGVAAGGLFIIVLGFMMRSDVFATVAAAGWFGVLLIGILLSLLLVGVGVGWPMMWCAIAAEKDGDAFDALSRSFSYVYQRFLRLLAYVCLAVFIGWLGWIVLVFFVSLTLDITRLFASIGMGAELASATFGQDGASVPDSVRFWERLWLSIPVSYPYAAFWTSAAVIYLLRRYDIDGAEFDAVYTEEDEDRLPLPSLAADPEGVPKVDGAAKDGPSQKEPSEPSSRPSATGETKADETKTDEESS